MPRMRLTITIPTMTYQSAAVLRAEGTWTECLALLEDERLDGPGAWVKLWFQEAMIAIWADPNDALGAIVQRQESMIHGIKVVMEFDPQ
jgi:hypothetical protein